MDIDFLSHEYFMKEALKEARKAFDEDEIPVGAVVVCNNHIIARAHNQTEKLNDVTAHAEMLAFTSAEEHIGSKYLKECTLYVTLEPCIMCAGAAYWTQLGELVYGVADEKRGYNLVSKKLLHPTTHVTAGIMHEECSMLLKEFFRQKRMQNQ
ncbi:MAG: nucleoside deaminase [Bacteroidales bacterium]|nr:nucleoside deaminase [Bacteroidales bacterium]